MIFYTLTIFLSAFLLFQVQPIIGRHVLPWFGGGPSVWSACMLFFQIFLLLGYFYAHLVSSRLPVRRQALCHLCVLLLSLFFASIAPSSEWKPSGDESPTLQILLTLVVVTIEKSKQPKVVRIALVIGIVNCILILGHIVLSILTA